MSPPPPPLQDNVNTVRTRAQSVSDYQAMDKKLDLIISQLGEVKSDSNVIKGDIVKIKEDLQEFKDDMTRTTEMCFDEIKDIKAKLHETDVKCNKHDTDIDFIKSENNKLKNEVRFLKKKLNAADQYSRANCLEIQGVPEVPSENVLDLVIKIASVLNFNLQPSMIDAVHRLAPNRKDNMPRNIIVKFCRRLDMEELRRRAIKMRGFSASNLGFSTDLNVYVNLAMSRETRVLWAETRRFKRDNNFKFAWISSSGKIFLRKSENDPPVLIEDSSDFPTSSVRPQRLGVPLHTSAATVSAPAPATPAADAVNS